MLTSDTFLSVTKRGNVLKVVRERYLRDDLGCGSHACESCPGARVLGPGAPIHGRHAYPHYLLPDTNIVLGQMDLLEEPAFRDVILLSTVLAEVRRRSAAVYKRLLDVARDPDRRFFVFINEYHRDTHVERAAGESANDRNDRAIREAVAWYNAHLPAPVRVVLLTDDVDNLRKSIDRRLPSDTIKKYIRGLPDAAILEDKLSKKNFILENDTKNPLFPPHLTPTEIHDGIKSGRLKQGGFVASRENYLEGNVNIEDDKTIFIQGREHLNRVIDGDLVAVEILPSEQWSCPSELVLEDAEDDPGDVLDDENIPLKRESTVAKIPTGKIVGIIRRKWRQYCGILQKSDMKGRVKHLFVPAERKIPKVRIETRQYDKVSTQRIIVAIDSWPRGSRYPLGHFVRALGNIGDKDTENEVLLLEHDVPHSKFSENVLECLPTLPWEIREEDVRQRVDLRHLDVCSVDPPGCTDIDDALHCRVLSNGNYEVGVHIADVSHFIRPGTCIDKEAAHRATTVYLVGKRIDMVPDLLSSNLCSLRGGQERFAFSCVWEMDPEANIISTRFHKSIIKSRQAMTYEEAQLKIDDSSQNDALAISLRQLNHFAKIMKKKRIQKGALVLASLEIRFNVDSETHDPIDVEAKKLRDTNSMVEEFMLLANISVAEKIENEFPECAMLRRHPEPPQSNFEPLIKAAENRGIKIKTCSGKKLSKSLDKAVIEGNPFFNTMLRILATRCMMQAVYFSSGTLQKDEYHHYGLACPIYTHFTSPIRRYADIIVHRLLAACIGADSTYPQLLDNKATSKLCENLNYRNRMAQYAGRASVALNTHLFFRGKVQCESGYVLCVRKNALQILIPKYGLEGVLYVSGKRHRKSAEAPVFIYSEEEQTQKCGDVVFHAFDPVTVLLSLDSTNVQHEKLVFDLVTPHIPGFSVSLQSDNSDNKRKKQRLH